jgi:uncharacterized membrane protein
MSELQILYRLKDNRSLSNISWSINVDLLAHMLLIFLERIRILAYRFNQLFESREDWSNTHSNQGILEIGARPKFRNVVWCSLLDFELLVVEEGLACFNAFFIDDLKRNFVLIFAVFSFF